MQDSQRYQATRKVTLVSGTTNSLLAVFKIIIGLIGHSHALIADGFHSLSDLVSDGLVLIAAKAGSRHPDEEHPYGHHRIETIAAITIAFILLSASGFIIYDAVIELIHYAKILKPDIWVLVMALISAVINEWLYRYNLKVGKRIHSNLLISNAWHNRSDAYTSLIVFASVLGAILGWHFLDGLAAIIIAIVIVKISVRIIWDSTHELIDRGVDAKTLEEISKTIQNSPGVISVHQLRTRLHSGRIFIDLHIIVDPIISVSEGHFISQQVHIRLNQAFKNIADVTVHIDPEDDETEMPSKGLPERTILLENLAPSWKNLPGFNSIKKINLHYLDRKILIEIYLPIKFAKEPTLAQQYQTTAQNKLDFIKSVEIYYF